MKNAKNLFAKAAKILPALALLMGVIAANSACVIYFHQPETPSAMDAYRR